MKEKKELTLALETVVNGGSISLLAGESEIDFRVGDDESLRAQNFLKQIRDLLQKNKISPSEIGEIAVATGPGSFTGIRIGISVALGLKTAWRCRISGISILEAMKSFVFQTGLITTKGSAIIISAIPFGKEDVCWQIFQNFENKNKLESKSPQVAALGDFMNLVDGYNGFSLITEQSLFKLLRNLGIWGSEKSKIINLGDNLARFVGFSVNQCDFSDLSPIYVQR